MSPLLVFEAAFVVAYWLFTDRSELENFGVPLLARRDGVGRIGLLVEVILVLVEEDQVVFQLNEVSCFSC